MKRILIVLSAITALAVTILAIAAFVISNDTPTDDPEPAAANESSEVIIFPTLRGQNVSFAEVIVPEELDDGLKLIIVAYDSNQQPVVDEWLAPLEDLNVSYPDLAGYYIPLLPKDTADASLFIIGGFAALAEENERERIIVVFTNVEGFNDIVGVEGNEDVQLFLLDADSTIIWRESGEFSADKLADLEALLATTVLAQ